MSFLFKKKDPPSAPTSPSHVKADDSSNKAAYSQPPPTHDSLSSSTSSSMQHSQGHAQSQLPLPHATQQQPQADAHSSAQDSAPMSVSPMSTSPLTAPVTSARSPPPLNHLHDRDRDRDRDMTSSTTPTTTPTTSPAATLAPSATHPQPPFTQHSSPPFSSHATAPSSSSSSSSAPSDAHHPTPSPAISIPATSTSSTLSSFPSFPAPQSPHSLSRDASATSSLDFAPFPVQEEKMSEDAIILRNHFASLSAMARQMFTIGDTLGTGTFGRVRLVSYHQPPLSPKPLHFALKMLKKSEILRLKQVEHIKAEKSILSRICHPFIVNLFTAFQDERYLYMLMEYVIGGELFSQLRKVGRFSNDTARFYAAEIVLALQYLHSKDIVYRDLKPENLLIDREGHIKITDFGFAKVVEDRTWTLCGTPEYLGQTPALSQLSHRRTIALLCSLADTCVVLCGCGAVLTAPEIIQSKGHGKAVDWWALGILIYEMIAGYPPFYDENPFGIYQKILAGRIEFPRHCDPYAKDLIKKLLTADRSKRFGCLKDGADDIKRHRWFKGVDWGRVHARRVKPPYVPGFASPDDTSNFDKYPESDGDDGATPLNQKDKEQFVDF